MKAESFQATFPEGESDHTFILESHLISFHFSLPQLSLKLNANRKFFIMDAPK
jgi:hypothetical protein